MTEEAKKSDDSTGKMLAKAGLLLVVVSEVILLVSDLSDYRKEKIGQEHEEDDE